MAQPRVVDAGRWRQPGLALLSYGFRPFFLFGAAVAALGVPAWLVMLVLGLEPPGAFDALRWHAHEMIFGYLAAVIAGFLLTAIPNWTGRLPLSGLPLAGLFGLWLVGRVAVFAVPEPGLGLVLDVAFLAALAAAVWREIIAGRNLRNLPVALLITVFAVANLLFHLQLVWPALDRYGERLALGAAALLIALIGGRIVPSFTRNWMARSGLAPLPVGFGGFDKLVLCFTGAVLAGWVLWPQAPVVGAGLGLAGVLHIVRLSRWRGLRSPHEPIVLILHLGYLWLAAALLLLGGAALAPELIGTTTALHALSAGAVGTMTLAVMTRASLGHTGRPIEGGWPTNAIYALVTLGAGLRVAAPFLTDVYLPALAVGGILWSAAFALFVAVYGPLLLRPGLGRI